MNVLFSWILFLDEKASEFDKGKIATQAELGIMLSL